jgi:hypothetical protein
VTGPVFLNGNPRLIRLQGLENLALVTGNFQLQYDDELSDVSALAGLTVSGGTLSFRKNPKLLDLSGMANLTIVNGDLLFGNAVVAIEDPSTSNPWTGFRASRSRTGASTSTTAGTSRASRFWPR